MAELLIKAAEDDRLPETPGKWKTGMPVVAKPDGHEWGKKEGPPRFYIMKFPGMSVDELKEYVEQETEETEHGKKMLSRRKFKLDVENLTLDKKQKLESTQGLRIDKDDSKKEDMDLKDILKEFKDIRKKKDSLEVVSRG